MSFAYISVSNCDADCACLQPIANPHITERRHVERCPVECAHAHAIPVDNHHTNRPDNGHLNIHVTNAVPSQQPIVNEERPWIFQDANSAQFFGGPFNLASFRGGPFDHTQIDEERIKQPYNCKLGQPLKNGMLLFMAAVKPFTGHGQNQIIVLTESSTRSMRPLGPNSKWNSGWLGQLLFTTTSPLGIAKIAEL